MRRALARTLRAWADRLHKPTEALVIRDGDGEAILRAINHHRRKRGLGPIR